MVTLDNLVVTTVLPVIRVELGASLESLEWTVNAYTLAYAVFLLTGAALGDRFGRRRMFTVGVAIFAVASALAALAPDAGSLVAARALQGLGAAIVTPLSLTLLSDAVPEGKRGLAIGAWSGIAGLGVALGPLVGGAIAEGISWQWVFWVNVPIGLVLVPVAPARPQREPRSPRAPRPARPRARGRRPDGARVRHRPRQRARLDERDRARLARRGRGPPDRVPALGAARTRADAAAALLPQPRLLGDERGLVRDVLRDLRLDLLPDAVLPDGSGTLARWSQAC